MSDESRDLQNRTKSFNAELMGLLAKYKLGIQPVVQTTIQVFDDSKPKPTKAEEPKLTSG